MDLLNLGGPVMWVLLLVSIVTLALIIERCIVYSKMPVPKGITPLSAREDVLQTLEGVPGLASFAAALKAPSYDEERVSLAGQHVIDLMEVRLDLLGAMAKLATLLGLLGTVLGMIDTFSAISSATGGIDMTSLAEGLWQALLTTAAGLTIAIPAGLALVAFEARVRRMAQTLTIAATRARDPAVTPPGTSHGGAS